MMLHAPPPPAGVTPSGGERTPAAVSGCPDADAALALILYTMWAARTGRSLRAVPVTELTTEELIGFWADDQLDPPPADPPCGPRSAAAAVT